MEALREGSKGPDVGALHQALVETGLQVDVTELDRVEFGPSTKEAVEDFQARHQDGQGRTLRVDGVVGPLTWAAISGGAQPPGKWTVPGWRCDLSEVPEPVRWVLQVARNELGVREQPPRSNRGPRVDQYTDRVSAQAAESGAPQTIEPGDVGCILRSRFHGHGFLVCGVLGDIVCTIEGNSGQAVRGLVRPVASLTAVVRPAGDL